MTNEQIAALEAAHKASTQPCGNQMVLHERYAAFNTLARNLMPALLAELATLKGALSAADERLRVAGERGDTAEDERSGAMTNEQIAALEAAHKASTQGEYTVERGTSFTRIKADNIVVGETYYPLGLYREKSRGLADFIATAHNLMPALLAELATLKGALSAADERLRVVGERGDTAEDERSGAMTNEQIAALEAAYKASTQGEWAAEDGWMGGNRVKFLCTEKWRDGVRGAHQTDADIEFIALSRNLMPALLDEIVTLRAELAKFTAPAKLTKMDYAAGSPMTMELSHPLVAIMAKSLADMVGESNYVETRMTAPDGRQFTMTVQRADGKTPHDFRREAESELVALKKHLKRELAARSQVSEQDATLLRFMTDEERRVILERSKAR